MWAILLITLPAQPNAVRLRIWRALKALGCVSLRDGTYLLPESHAASLEALALEAREHGGDASVYTLSARDELQQADLLARFDRTEAYAAWRDDSAALLVDLDRLTEPEARKRLRGCEDALAAVRATDHYPGPAADQAEAVLQDLRLAVNARFSRGEPQPSPDQSLPRLDPARFQGKRWATRARPWVDRLACGWLIGRFIDAKPSFVWLDDPAAAPRGVIGFDYDGARFSHVGARVTFEVLLHSFGLSGDSRLQRLAEAVHYLDVSGIPVPEAAGLEAVLAGLRALHADDDDLLRAAGAVFDAFHAAEGPRA